jgi:hypothetical protein
MAKMIDMKQKKSTREKMSSPSKIEGDQYPYGLRVSLDHDSAEKLGLHKNPPKVGSKLMLRSHAHVKSHDITHDEHGKPKHRIELELQKMAIEASKPEHAGDTEGQLKGAKAAMDKALDVKEGEDD